MAVLHVLNPGAIGGRERVVQMLAIAQRTAGIDAQVVTVLTPADLPHAEAFTAPLREAGVPVHEVRVGSRAYVAERRALRATCAHVAPFVVHTHGYHADVIDGGVARAVGAARVTTMHGFTGGEARNRLYEALQARAARACDAVVAVSRPLQEELLRRHVSAKQLHVVANACVPPAAPLTRREARQALGIPAEIWTIGWIGRLSGEKGADILFDALDGLPGFMWQAVMVGDGPERARLESRARARHPDRTYWTGALHDAARYFAAFDVIVNSSRTEGTPIVLLEAMAAGVPIVATRVGGVPDILDDTTSWLVPPAHPAALAAAVADAFRQPGLADRRARAAMLRFQRDHAPREWVHRYQAVYGAALRRARTRW